ncbi:hypothetical protein D3C72_1452370 [compost metagenome]
MLARGAAAEVLARQQDRGAAVARLVQHEVRVQRPRAAVLPGLAVVKVAPFVEQVGPETAAPDRFQELLGQDGVGIDIGAVQRRDQAVQGGKGFHGSVSCGALQRADIDEVPRHGGRGCHLRAHQVGPAAGPLPAFEIAV